MPMRIFTVTGTPPAAAARPPRTMRANSRRACHGSAAPPPLRVTLGTGQPKFRSMWSAQVLARRPSDRAPGHDRRVDAVELQATRRLVGANATMRSVFGLRSTSARVVIISLTYRPAPVLAAQPAERRVGDAGHRREHDRRVDRERAELRQRAARRPARQRAGLSAERSAADQAARAPR